MARSDDTNGRWITHATQVRPSGRYSPGCLSFEYDPVNDVVYRVLVFMNFPGYKVGTDGSVWSKGKRLKVDANERGHCRVPLGGGKRLLVHHVVLSAFDRLRPDGLDCRHLDGNARNNRLENLCWGTKKENMADRDRHGTTQRGVRHHAAKINPGIAKHMRYLHEVEGMSQCALARMFGVNGGTVNDVLHYRTWKPEYLGVA